ncbi:MAG TPA: AI-2E family transporter [Rudaea sp.]|nr:AI-2E family transporter [Rudaea sp.]
MSVPKIADEESRAHASRDAPRAQLRTISRSLITLVVLVALAVSYAAQEVLIPIVLALLVSLLLSPVVNLLERIRVPRLLGSLAMLVLVLGLFVAAIAGLAQPARDWVAHAPDTIQTIERRFGGLREPLREAEQATKQIEDLARSGSAQPVVNAQPSLLASMATSTPRALADVAAVIILLYFFLSSGDGFLRRVVEIAPTLSDKKLVVSIARDVQGEISRYLATISTINFCLGLATAGAMWLIGLPSPLLWGAVATILNFAPYIGPTTTGVALALAGFAAFDSLGHALAPPGAFLALAVLEGQFVTPTILGRRLALDPTVVFVWLLVWGWLWGVIGVLLAGPMLACFRIVCQHVESLRPVCVLIGDGSSSDVCAKGAAAKGADAENRSD